MFSGIVEAVSEIRSSEALNNAYRIQVSKPDFFEDLRLGDSIAVDGICLTVEAFDSLTITFSLAAETLRVLEWNPAQWLGKKINLERSLRMGDRIHGHMVTGHVDSLGFVVRADLEGESFMLDIIIQDSVRPFVWKKGSIAVNGVSLTVNEVVGDVLSLCLIPETLKRTNLGQLQAGSFVNIEPDYLARAIQRSLQLSTADAQGPL
jgi:riboflavin synthase